MYSSSLFLHIVCHTNQPSENFKHGWGKNDTIAKHGINFVLLREVLRKSIFLNNLKPLDQKLLDCRKLQLEASKHLCIHLYCFFILFAIPTNRWRTPSMDEENDTTAKHGNTFCFAKRSFFGSQVSRATSNP